MRRLSKEDKRQRRRVNSCARYCEKVIEHNRRNHETLAVDMWNDGLTFKNRHRLDATNHDKINADRLAADRLLASL